MSRKRLAGLEAQLPADHVELVALGAIDVAMLLGEVAAGVDHLLVEEEPVEIVRDVVVIGDIGLVGGRIADRARSRRRGDG